MLCNTTIKIVYSCGAFFCSPKCTSLTLSCLESTFQKIDPIKSFLKAHPMLKRQLGIQFFFLLCSLQDEADVPKEAPSCPQWYLRSSDVQAGTDPFELAIPLDKCDTNLGPSVVSRRSSSLKQLSLMWQKGRGEWSSRGMNQGTHWHFSFANARRHLRVIFLDW